MGRRRSLIRSLVRSCKRTTTLPTILPETWRVDRREPGRTRPCRVGKRVGDVVPRTSRVARRGPCTGQAISLESRIGDKCRSARWQLAGLPGLENRRASSAVQLSLLHQVVGPRTRACGPLGEPQARVRVRSYTS